MSERRSYQDAGMAYFAMMRGVYAAMPERERRRLHEWERTHLDGRTVGTSDWPGWERYIGLYPVPPPRPAPTPKTPIPEELRWAVWERDNFICQMCGGRQQLSVDHIVPESKGGTLDLDNLQTLCRRCNSRKGTRERQA